jgi:acyl-CoA synthetase (AMP-forming)/AMP-acid ligase II
MGAPLRTLAYGGAPMPTRVIEKALALWPEVGFVNAYGATETNSTIAVLGPEEHRESQPRGCSRSAGATRPRITCPVTVPG